MQLRIACILRVIFINSCRNCSGTEGGRGFIFVTDTSRFCRVFRAEPCCGLHHARWVMNFGSECASYFLRHVHSVATLVVQADCACRSRAAFSSGGSFLPRFEALCRIPRQAFGLKQYFSGAFAIKICVVSPSGGRCHEVTEGLTDRPRKMRFLLWGTPQYCASSTRQAIEKPSASISPAVVHFSNRGTETLSSLT